MEPGEVTKAAEAAGTLRTAELTQDQIQQLGRSLGAQGLFLGSVSESGLRRSGGTTEATVTINVRLVETETGEVVWSATHTESGRGFWNAVFGGSGASLGEVSRKAARRVLSRLVN